MSSRLSSLVDQLSPVVRNKVAARGATSWLEDLPGLLKELEDRWSLSIGSVFDSGTEAFVATAEMEGQQVVMKLLIPVGDDPDRLADEITVLELADGDGCVRLLRSDRSLLAMVVERLGPSIFDLGLPIEDRHRHLVDAAQALWRPAPDVDLPTGAHKVALLVDMITGLWEELDRPCSEQVVTHALDCAERRRAAHDDERAVLVHGDVHQWNALRDGDRFKLVDPDGLLAEPEYDLGILMREDPLELMSADPGERARKLASMTGLDANAIWEWGVVERVSTGLLCVQIELQPEGDQMLAAAEHVVSVDVAL